jgi:putative ABC transport system permease protein
MISVAKVVSNMKNNKVHEVEEYVNLFNGSLMNFTITPETKDKSKVEQGRNVSIKFVNMVPLDTLPDMEQVGPQKKNPLFFTVMAPYSIKDKFETSNAHVYRKGLTFSSKKPTQVSAVMKNMLQDAGITDTQNLINFSGAIDQSRNMIFIANVFGYTFVILISLIAIANVFNTISTNIKLRRRELAMLRSVGMSDKDFQKMMNFECAFYGMKALLFGLPIAAIFSWLIYKGMFTSGAENINFEFPWVSTAISIFSVFFVVFITMLYSISKIKKENIIDALRDDMT